MDHQTFNNHINVSRETFEKLEHYYALLIKWNKTHNLISRNEEQNIWFRHIIDCVQLGKYIPNDVQRTVDFGSGAGFPGLILAIVNPKLNISLIESNHKKTAFLKQASLQLDLRTKVYSERIEKIKPLTASLITARALASVEILCEYAFIHLQKEGKCLFQKGRDVDEELATASKKWHFDYQKYTSIVETDSVILKISNLEFKH